MQDHPEKAELPEDDENDDSIVLLEDEDGVLFRFELLEMLHLDNKHYAALIPLDETETEEEASVVFVEILELGKDTEHYEAVTDAELNNRLFQKFQEEFGDLYQFS